MGDIVLLIFSLAVILAGAGVFTNAVEWLGKRLNLGEGAVGSILAAVGTALPETMVPVMAVLGLRGTGGEEVGIGAILGAPFMLASLALFILGLAIMIFRRGNKPLQINSTIVMRDLKYFIVVYALAIMASFLPGTLKSLVIIMLLGGYGVYVYQTIKAGRGKTAWVTDVPPFYFSRKTTNPSLLIILGQLLAALLIILVGARFFVTSLQQVAIAAGIPVLILSLIITPVATELPEKFNSIIWAARGKDNLALGNITGAMVFQGSLIPALGIAFTPWILEPLALTSALLALVSACLQYFFLLRHKTLYPAGLLWGGVFYAVFMFLAFKGL
ncbi:MAG: sodium:calcium antiporter [Peptococcaceae bacterium]|nr:sodium:calcium antiporter [Peptococcaceae bacterium]